MTRIARLHARASATAIAVLAVSCIAAAAVADQLEETSLSDALGWTQEPARAGDCGLVLHLVSESCPAPCDSAEHVLLETRDRLAAKLRPRSDSTPEQIRAESAARLHWARVEVANAVDASACLNVAPGKAMANATPAVQNACTLLQAKLAGLAIPAVQAGGSSAAWVGSAPHLRWERAANLIRSVPLAVAPGSAPADLETALVDVCKEGKPSHEQQAFPGESMPGMPHPAENPFARGADMSAQLEADPPIRQPGSPSPADGAGRLSHSLWQGRFKDAAIQLRTLTSKNRREVVREAAHPVTGGNALHALLGADSPKAWQGRGDGILELVLDLIALGSDPDARDSNGQSPLHFAVRLASTQDHTFQVMTGGSTGRMEPMRVSKQAAAQPPAEAKGPESMVVDAERVRVSEEAIETTMGRLPVLSSLAKVKRAMRSGTSRAVIAVLLAAGADPAAIDARGQTPMHLLGRLADIAVWEWVMGLGTRKDNSKLGKLRARRRARLTDATHPRAAPGHIGREDLARAVVLGSLHKDAAGARAIDFLADRWDHAVGRASQGNTKQGEDFAGAAGALGRNGQVFAVLLDHLLQGARAEGGVRPKSQDKATLWTDTRQGATSLGRVVLRQLNEEAAALSTRQTGVLRSLLGACTRLLGKANCSTHLNAPGMRGQTVLGIAADTGFSAAATVIAAVRGVDVSARDAHNMTAQDIARERGFTANAGFAELDAVVSQPRLGPRQAHAGAEPTNEQAATETTVSGDVEQPLPFGAAWEASRLVCEALPTPHQNPQCRQAALDALASAATLKSLPEQAWHSQDSLAAGGLLVHRRAPVVLRGADLPGAQSLLERSMIRSIGAGWEWADETTIRDGERQQGKAARLTTERVLGEALVDGGVPSHSEALAALQEHALKASSTDATPVQRFVAAPLLESLAAAAGLPEDSQLSDQRVEPLSARTFGPEPGPWNPGLPPLTATVEQLLPASISQQLQLRKAAVLVADAGGGMPPRWFARHTLLLAGPGRWLVMAAPALQAEVSLQPPILAMGEVLVRPDSPELEQARARKRGTWLKAVLNRGDALIIPRGWSTVMMAIEPVSTALEAVMCPPERPASHEDLLLSPC